MPGARHERWGGYGARSAHWPFSLPEVEPPQIAPEFRANLERILSTSRFYLQIESGRRRQGRHPRQRAG